MNADTWVPKSDIQAEFVTYFIYLAALHKSGAYKHLMNEEDKENLKWLNIFK